MNQQVEGAVISATDEEELAAMTAGYDSAGTDKPLPESVEVAEPKERNEEKPVSGAAAVAEAPKAKEPATQVPDPFKAVSERMDRESAETKRMFTEMSGALSGINAHLQALKEAGTAAATEAKKAGEEAPSKAAITAAVKDSEKWKQLKSDYPDWAEAMEEQFGDVRAQLASAKPIDTAKLRGEIEGNIFKSLGSRDAAIRAEARQMAVLDVYHPDWETTVASKEFLEWQKTIPAELYALRKSPKASDAKKLIDAYAEHAKKAAKAAANKQRLEDAKTPKGEPAPGTEREATEEEAMRLGYEGAR